MKSKLSKAFAILFLAFSLPFASYSQDLPPDDPIDTPIDGGVGVLIAAGAIYGIRQIKGAHKKH